VRQGHEVTLFASGDSRTQARLVPACARALRLDPDCVNSLPHHMRLLHQVFSQAHRFDVIHFHVDYLHFPFSVRQPVPHVTTLHGRLDMPDLVPLYRVFDEVPVVSISDAQRAPLSWINWQATVHHGLPLDLLEAGDGSGGYLAFLGRIAREKRVDRAIEIARRVGMPLKIAAKVDRADREYFEREIVPLLDDPLVEYIGEIDEGQKPEFLGNAAALLFPVDWPEPFGLVMIEAMACGTPVIAWRCGSVPEVIEPGLTGYVVDSVEEAVSALQRLPGLARTRCRARFEERFSVERMARDYVGIYEQVAEQAAVPAVSVKEAAPWKTLFASKTITTS